MSRPLAAEYDSNTTFESFSFAPKRKWSLHLCHFDPVLSECLGPLPVPRRRLVGATRCQVFLPTAPTVDWIRSIGPSFLARRTKLLDPVRRSSTGIQSRMNYNDRGEICQNLRASSTKMFARSDAGSERGHIQKPHRKGAP